LIDSVLSIVLATLRTSTPLLLAALAGLFSERGGVIDVGLEGKMLVGAFAAASVAAVTGQAGVGLVAAVAASCVFGMVHGYASVTLRGSQVVSGMAINIIASGLTATLALFLFHQGGQTPMLGQDARFLPVIAGQTVLTLGAFVLVPVSAFVLGRTRFGLRLRACGEHPAAAETAGVDVARMRYAGVMIAAVLCGVAGASIATAQGAGFTRNMVSGRGYIALAAMILGGWRPWPIMAACLAFGLLDAVAIRLAGVALPGIGVFPTEAVQALPYFMVLLLLAGVVGRSVPPAAAGEPYVKER
jgi:ABC-type uncharacterized transport system permease subunit